MAWNFAVHSSPELHLYRLTVLFMTLLCILAGTIVWYCLVVLLKNKKLYAGAPTGHVTPMQKRNYEGPRCQPQQSHQLKKNWENSWELTPPTLKKCAELLRIASRKRRKRWTRKDDSSRIAGICSMMFLHTCCAIPRCMPVRTKMFKVVFQLKSL